MQNGRIVAMAELHNIYALIVDDRRYKYHLKQLIEAKFKEKITIYFILLQVHSV